ncbi:MAG: phosphotransferase, partial [Defluviitaleaceae bacterium]|nr:phosphotransferase [Defluviitaleaceae bacterium]
FVQGNDLWSVIRTLTDGQKHIIGKEIAQFLNGLHSVTGVSYDIGHYIPAVPGCKKSWKDGHIEYAGLLKGGLSTLGLEAKSECAITKAFAFIYANIGSLEYQTGAVLLHNDFHPKNIIVRDGRLAGVIDWECSQFGEPDFELAHLFHWCAYPPIPENDLGPLLKSVAENLRITSDVPNIEARLTIYQLEHELNQLVWNGKSQESERIQRINGWLGGRVYALFEEWRNETGFRF